MRISHPAFPMANDFPADISYDIDNTLIIVKILKYMMIFGRHIRLTGDKIIRYE